MDSAHNYHAKTQRVEITEITGLRENKWESRSVHSDCTANKSNHGTLQTSFHWRTADSAFIISSSHTFWRWSRNLSICPSEHQGTAPWCPYLLSTPVQRWWWLSTSPEHIPSISKPPVSPSPPHHLCGAEGNDPFGWLPRHFLSNGLSVSLQTICCAPACVSRSTYRVPSHLSVLLWYSFFKVACGENIAAPSNIETQPVTGTNYSTVVSDRSGESSERPCEWPLLTVHFTPLSNFVHLEIPEGAKGALIEPLSWATQFFWCCSDNMFGL